VRPPAVTVSHAPGDCPGWRAGVYTYDQCRECHGKNAGTRVGPARAVPSLDARPRAIPVEAVPGRPDCIELGPALPNQTCGCAEKLRKCDTHGQCTTGIKRDGVACCRTCPDYDDGRVVEALPIPATIAVTHWERPRALERLLVSITTYLPGLPVEVEDTGGNLSAARNRLYRRITTPYLVMFEEDFVVRPDTAKGLLDAFDILTSDPQMRGVGGVAHEPRRGSVRWGHGWQRNGDIVRPVASVEPLRKTPSGVAYRPCRLVLNFGLFRTDNYRAVPWNERLPIQEHQEWFWRATQAGWWFAFYSGLAVSHLRDRPHAAYGRARNRSFAGAVYAEHGVRFWSEA
jgi:hypothetical protein